MRVFSPRLPLVSRVALMWSLEDGGEDSPSLLLNSGSNDGIYHYVQETANSNIRESEGKLSLKRSVSLALLHCVAKGSRDQGGNCIMARVQLCLTALFKLVEGTTIPQCKGVLTCSIVIYTWSCQVSLYQCTNFRPHSGEIRIKHCKL